MAFVLVQHLDPAHASFMVSLLASHTKMKVSEAGEGTQLEPNNVYVIPPGRYLTILGSELHLSPVGGSGRARMPFDVLLESLAEAYGERAACAVLSGTGSDGSIGAEAIREKGGLTIAQDPEEAEFDSMPRNAIAAGAIGFILPLGTMAEALVDFAKRGIRPSERSRGAFPPEFSYAKIVDLLRTRTAHDFDLHKRGTLMRRIERRMALANIEDPALYLEFLEKDASEVRNLVDDLFINVTHFFRDSSAFEQLRTKVLPELVRSQPYNQPIRAWVAGCSTGEEAYSVAIILSEAINETGRNIKLTVFASDIDEEAIAFAREGLYPATIEANVSATRLARFFVKEDQGYRVQRGLRDLVVFSLHDLLSDAPFSRMDLISCCNVLIYLRPEVQQQVLGLFHFALREGGILFLGSAGSVGEATDRFEPIAEKERIYRHIARSRPGEIELPLGRGEFPRSFWPRPIRRPLVRRPGISDLAQQLLLQTYAPASVVTNLRNEGLYYYGPIDRYLRMPEGEASQAILAAAREGLRPSLRTALHKAVEDQEPIVVKGVQVRRNGDTATVAITVQPVKSDGEQLLLVSFIDEPPPSFPSEAGPAAVSGASDEGVRVVKLEHDLENARQELEDQIHEREVAEEELKAVNEEAMSLNEEFQTTNEELQTSKEELQSLNEELTTLNVQLQETVDREHGIADDLHNILSSTDVGTLFLDENINIRFFTPSARPLFNLIPSDIGRPMSDLARNFSDGNLIPDARAVLAKWMPISREVAADGATVYMRRILPYRTRENVVKGVVVTYVDISELRTAEHAAASAYAYTESMVGEIRGPLLVLDQNLRVVSASRAFYKTFATGPSDTVGRDLTTIDGGYLNVKELEPVLEKLRADADAVSNCELQVELPGIGRRTVILNAVAVPLESDAPRRILVAIDDITARKHQEVALLDAKQEAETANLSKSRFLAAASHDLRQPIQTLNLLQGALTKQAKSKEGKLLVARMGETLDTITGMLDTLLGISQLEAGIVKPNLSTFPINKPFESLRASFAQEAASRGLEFRVVASRFIVKSDPRLFEQMLRNLLSNAIKYTEKGGILLGCRQRGDTVRVEVWDTGVGISKEHLDNIFREFYQINNPARQSSLGTGLGLAIARRAADLLGHKLDVRSRPGHGSVFSITVPLAHDDSGPASLVGTNNSKRGAVGGNILILDDDSMVRESLALFLKGEGYRIASAATGAEALALVSDGAFQPDAAIIDYTLPGELNGVEVMTRLSEMLGRHVPALVLTGRLSAGTVKEITSSGFMHHAKPMHPEDLSRFVAALVAKPGRS